MAALLVAMLVPETYQAGGLLLVDVAKHHDGAVQQTGRVGNVLVRNVGRASVHRLKHRRLQRPAGGGKKRNM